MIKDKSWVKISIDKLAPAGWNYKEDDDEQMKNLVNNLKRIGQVENIMIRRLKTGYFEVINGNHRLEAFKELEYKKAVCFNFGTISLADAKRIAVETNETKFQSDSVELAKLIAEITEEDFTIEDLAATMPFDESQLESMKELLEFEWKDEDEDEDEEETKKDKIITCPNCEHKWVK